MGLSALSSSISILAAQIPAQPVAPTTVISGLNVLVRWIAPDNGGSQITAYLVQLQKSDGTFTT